MSQSPTPPVQTPKQAKLIAQIIWVAAMSSILLIMVIAIIVGGRGTSTSPGAGSTGPGSSQAAPQAGGSAVIFQAIGFGAMVVLMGSAFAARYLIYRKGQAAAKAPIKPEAFLQANVVFLGLSEAAGIIPAVMILITGKPWPLSLACIMVVAAIALNRPHADLMQAHFEPLTSS